MDNKYLYINETKDSILHIESFDNVFFSSGNVQKGEKFVNYCREKADWFRNSPLGNYEILTSEEREELAKKWEAVADLGVGKYEYYFNLGGKEELEKIFIKYVSDLATQFNIKYELTVI